MSDEPHDVVKLLVARMESHPEEFRVADAPFHDRWYDHVNGVHAYGSEDDKAAMAAGLRKIRLGEIHERVMDELLNGEERRRKVEEDREYERRMSQSLALAQQQMMQQAQQGLQNAYANQLGQAQGFQNANALGQLGAYDYDRDKWKTPIGSITGTKANSIMIDDEELDASMIKKMKRMISGRSK